MADAQNEKPTELISYHYYDPMFSVQPFGLGNTGAICWFNSLLQVLLGLPAFNKVLLEHEHDLLDNVFATEYINILKAAIGKEKPPASLSQSSAALLGAMMTRAKTVGRTLQLSGGQECVDEGFVNFIELLGCPQVERLFSNVYELSIKCTKCNKITSSIRDKSFRIQMFTQVPNETDEKFHNYLKAHPSEHDYYVCDCGHKMAKFYRAERLKSLREIVVIIFNKFLTKDVRHFPQELSFGSKNDGGKGLKYELVGKVEHAGTRVSGHYWAHSLRVNNQSSKWTKLNDTGVSIGDPAPTAGTFMIVYHLVNPAAK